MDFRMEVADRMEEGVVSDTDMMKGGRYRGEDRIHATLLVMFKVKGGEAVTLLRGDKQGGEKALTRHIRREKRPNKGMYWAGKASGT